MSSVCHSSRQGESASARPPFVWRLGEVVSSLDAAFLLALRGRLIVWDSLLAASQTAGRGQLRRRWASPPGNIYAALRLPPAPPFDGTAASPLMGLLLALALREEGWPVELKWPNDLVLRVMGGMPRKVAGILLEERGGILLAGIGVNVNNAPPATALRKESALEAASLAQTASAPGLTLPPAELLWERLVKHMHSSYTNGLSQPGQWKTHAEQLLLWRGREVELHDERQSAHGRLVGLSTTGGLCLRVNGKLEEFLSGSLRLTEASVKG
ncbi:biotin--[acetyl-CoA-carboxylase] ligase [Desulfovibrio sp. ZJ200]|uniref:biotin--[acetyl-CoA-carboxylase] ligase n=1 Tax=Desulfovibrio sp. ZJ200 TaxID=2709792 RepID=UPI0013EBDACF|nr:biotin--[acetyl-CoA-carboxylase] ligase [Desulfovibrio sp. ZJ200]